MTITTPLPPTDELLTQRRLAVSKSSDITGLDYVQYNANAPTQLALHFINKIISNPINITPPDIDISNILITINTPGTGNTTFVLNSISSNLSSPNILLLDITGTIINLSDNTVYTLSLNNLNDVDIFLSQADFSISANAQAEFDPLQPTLSATVNLPAVPYIDYMSRDFLSFRQLMLNRISVLIPDWQAGNPADLGSVIIEILAYAADYLSYYQDAVTTEAYLETARLRVSVKRHSRLLDYVLSEGCNARVWVHVDVNQEIQLPFQTLLLTQGSMPPGAIAANSDTYRMLMNEEVITFATLYDTTLYLEFNTIDFYTWGSQDLTLAAGATSATLAGNLLNLQVGDVLAFEQVKGATTGLPGDADTTQRCVVRLTQITPANDPLYNQAVTEITWNEQDALPFDLVISSIINGNPVTGITQACGNMVLADQGQFVNGEPLIPAIVPDHGTYYPSLAQLNLTFNVPFDLDMASTQGASQAVSQDPQQAQAYIALTVENETWQVVPDLLGSNYLSRNFVVEIEDNRQAFIRFGDGVFGKLPSAGSQFTANYRTGNGSTGNVGANTVAYIVVDASLTTSITSITNPIPAQGGLDPEPTEQAILYAPKAFQQQERCVTVADYIQVTSQYPNATITSVNAILSWTGSWNTVFIAVQIAVQSDVTFNDNFKQALLSYLAQYELLHHDLEIIPPQWVPLEITLSITVQTGYLFNVVQQSLLQRFSSKILPDGSRGFFYPDNFTFGQSVYLSDIEVAIMETPGVASVDTTTINTVFRRFNDDPNAALTQTITMGPFEIAQVLNNPNVPQTGSIQFLNMESTV